MSSETDIPLLPQLTDLQNKHVSRLTSYVLRFTFYVLRFTD